MIKLLKKQTKTKNKIFFKSKIGCINIFFVDKIILIPNNVKINIQEEQLIFKGFLGQLTLKSINNILFFYKKNKLKLIVVKSKNKKSILNLYTKLIKIKLKGILQGYKINLILKGIGFKAFIENNNYLNFKLGFSHNILIKIPNEIKVIIQSNNIIFSSTDFILLSQFVHFVRNHKKPEPYKGKGLVFKNEKIVLKEGKKNKK